MCRGQSSVQVKQDVVIEDDPHLNGQELIPHRKPPNEHTVLTVFGRFFDDLAHDVLPFLSMAIPQLS